MTQRVISHRLYVDWNFDGAYTLEPALLIAARGEMRMAPPEDAIGSGRGMIDTASLTLRNSDGLLSPLRSDGTYYALIRDGGMYHAPCYLEISIDGGATYSRVITGVLKLSRESALTARSGATVSVEVRGDEERILQRHASTPMAQFAAWHDAGATEAEIIKDILVNVLDLTLPGDAGRLNIDPGMFSIPYAYLDDESTVEYLWKLSNAAGGRYYADPDGVHRYDSLAHWVIDERSTTVQARYSKDDYARLDAWYDDRSLYSEVTVQATPSAEAYNRTVWTIEAPLLVYPGTTEKVTAELEKPLYEIDSATWTARTLGGTDASGNISITRTDYAQRIEFAIQNTGSLLVAVARLTVVGRAIVADAAQSVTLTSADNGINGAFFTARQLTRARRIATIPQVQTLPHAQALAQYLLDRSERPRLTFKLTDCPGNPALRLGDLIHIADNDWLYQDSKAGGSASIVKDGHLVIDENLTIAYAPVLIETGVTVTVTGIWRIINDAVATNTTISEDVTIVNRTDSSGELRTDGSVLIETGVTVTVLGTWMLQDEGVYAYVTGISWQIANTFRQTIEAVSIDGMFAYAGDYFVVGADKLGSTKKVFY